MGKRDYRDYLIVGLILLVIILGVSLIEPYTESRSKVSSNDSSGASMNMPGMPAMVQKTYEVPPGDPVPTVDFDLMKDTLDGWDLHIITSNFTFTPEKINTDPESGEGHAHLYIDDQLIVVLGNWYHIDSIPPGRHTIRVSLNNNDHSVYSVGGKYIQAEKTMDFK